MSNTDQNQQNSKDDNQSGQTQSEMSMSENAGDKETEVIEVAEPAAAAGSASNEAAASSPGAMLKAARLAAGVSIEELVGETKLTKTAIDALENNEFSLLPKPVYVRGYYKKCAQVLNADENAIVNAYVAMAGEEKAPEPVAFTVPTAPAGDFSATKRGGGGNIFGSGMFILILGCVVGGLAFWYLNSDKADDADASDDTVLELPLGDSADEANASSSSTVVTTVLETGSDTESDEKQNTTAVSSADVTQQPDSEESVAEEAEITETADSSEALEDDQAESAELIEEAGTEQSGPMPVVGNGEIAIKFKEACWTDIRDSDGERLLFGLIDAGTEHRIGGEAPYRVLLGNPQGVEMSFKGQPFDLAPHTRANKTAVFSLGG